MVAEDRRSYGVHLFEMESTRISSMFCNEKNSSINDPKPNPNPYPKP
jgi:hypothetical protein